MFSQFSLNLNVEYLIILKICFRYFQTITVYKLVYLDRYCDPIKLKIFSDVDWAGNKEIRRFTTSYIALLNRTAKM